jgi:hypothetical protein
VPVTDLRRYTRSNLEPMRSPAIIVLKWEPVNMPL